MKAFVAAAFAVQLVAAAVDYHSIPHETKANYVPNSYIIGLNGNSHLKRGFSSPHAELEHDLQRRGITYVITKTFSNPRLWNGAAIKITKIEDLIQIAQAQGVTSINRNYLYDIPRSPDGTIPLNPVVIDKLSTHQMTGVNKMHGYGYFGKGIKIGIIDSGIDYTHPALGGKIGPGNKVIGGYDFVGDAYNGKNTAQPDNDPLDQCNGHGTHVAGIIGANPGNQYNISGVAYEASINAYRVFGCKGSVADEVVISAMNRAFDDGNHVINLSLGDSAGWTEGAMAVVASNLVGLGRVVTTSAGNNGGYGSWYSGSPATGINAIAVGSVDNVVTPLQNATDSTGRQIAYFSGAPLANGTFPIYATSTNTSVPNDACTPLPASTPDLSSYVVVIRRGGCAFIDKLNNAAAKGGKLFFVYNNLIEPLDGIDIGSYNGALISKPDGEYIINNLFKNNGTITFSDIPYNQPSETGGLMSSFSSYGPTYDMYFKPALAAPGGHVLSTYPVALGSYKTLSGTSMAAPLVAGAAALYLQAKGPTADNAKAVRSVFQNTASYIPNSKANNSLPETASQAGAGLIQVFDACFSTGSMLPAELLLNDTANFAGSQSVRITNKGSKAVTYTLTHIPAGTTNTIDGIENVAGPVPVINAPASVTINPSRITVLPGLSANVGLVFTPPTGLNANKFPIYSGFIQAKGSDGSTLHSSYLGLAASLRDMKVLDNTTTYFGIKVPFVSDQNQNPISNNPTFSLQGNSTPIVIYRLVAGSPLLKIDLFDANANVTSNQRRSIRAELDTRDLVHGRPKHTLPHSPISKRADKTVNPDSESLTKRNLLDFLLGKNTKPKTAVAVVPTTPVVCNLFSEDYLPRNSPNSLENDGYERFVVSKCANGSAIPSGNYKIQVTAQRINSAEVESWVSPTFKVQTS